MDDKEYERIERDIEEEDYQRWKQKKPDEFFSELIALLFVIVIFSLGFILFV